MTSSGGFKALAAAAAALGRLDRRTTRVLAAARASADGFFGQALSPKERAALGKALYNDSPEFSDPGKLFDWEARWFEGTLPKPGGRILVGGCGAGRELLALEAMGYRVDGFDPAPRYVQQCQERSLPDALVLVGDYESLTQTVLEDRPVGRLGELCQRRYEAVLLGWGSFTHVLEPNAQLRALQALARLCPDGPLLLSFWGEGLQGAPRRRQGRAFGLGQRLGGALGRWRGVTSPASDAETYITTLGFGYTFGAGQLEGLALALGRRLEWTPDPQVYGHAALWPR